MPAGRPPGKKMQKSRTSKPVINREAKLLEIKTDPEGTEYRCTACGKYFKKQKGNFFSSSSPLFTGNNGYVSTCKTCTEKYFNLLVDVFTGNEEKALDKICSIFDWYYNDEIAATSKKIEVDRSRLSSYVSKLNLIQHREKGTTYLDTIKDRATGTIDTVEDFEKVTAVSEKNEKTISPTAVTRWGLGFSIEEYEFLEHHYETLKSQISEDDPMQEIYIKDMCVTKIMQSRAQKSNDADKYEKFQKSYQATAKAANLKPIEKNTDGATDAYGVFISLIEQYAPADLYKRPQLFKDIDALGEYYKRFIARPFKNFFTGSREQDYEYYINPGDDDG